MNQWLMVINLGMFLMFSVDKWAARSGYRRFPERWLILGSLAGGAGGALLAMIVWRHKTRKRLFRYLVPMAFFIWLILWKVHFQG